MVSRGDKAMSTETGTGPTDIGEPSLGLLVIFSLIGLSLVMLAMSVGIFLSISV